MLSLLVQFSPLVAQNNLSNSGKEFYISFDRNLNKVNNANFNPKIFVTSAVNTTIVVEFGNGLFKQDFVLAANVVKEIQLNVLPEHKSFFSKILDKVPSAASSYAQTTINDLGSGNEYEERVDNGAIHLYDKNMQHDLTVYAHNYMTGGGDAYLAYPVTSLGNNYMVMSYPSTIGNINYQTGSFFSLIATKDNTTIKLKIKDKNNSVINVEKILSKGQSYRFYKNVLNGAGTDNSDFTGTEIESNFPIAVFSGNVNTNVPYEGGNGSNHIVEQLTPIETWGNNFVLNTIEVYSPVVGVQYKILASKDNTEITINGIKNYLNKGQSYTLTNIAVPLFVTSNFPVLIAQFSYSATQYTNSGNYTDPIMVLCSPIEQFKSNYYVYCPLGDIGVPQDIYLYNNYVLLTIPKSTYEAGNATMFDAVILESVPNFPDKPIGDYYIVLKKVKTTGSTPIHLLGYPSVAFGVTVFGVRLFDAYGYIGGQNFNFINSTINYSGNCAGQVTSFTTGLTASNNTFTWNFGDQQNISVGEPIAPAALITGLTAEHTYNLPGIYSVQVTETSESGQLLHSYTIPVIIENCTNNCDPVAPLKYGHNWNFGLNTSLKFNDNGPEETSGSNLTSIGACNSISDRDGKLLCYTDGKKIYNSKHTVIQNGNFSSILPTAGTQSGLIVPLPGSASKYLVFFTPQQNIANKVRFNLKKYFAVVDISQNSGNGAVIGGLVAFEDGETEKMDIVRHANSVDYWLITVDHDKFNVYTIDQNGLQYLPTSLKKPKTYTFPNLDFGFGRTFGYMKASPSGRYLALANYRSSIPVYDGYGASELYDFDPSTGVVSNKRYVITGNQYDDFYGVAFSPDEEFVYFTTEGTVLSGYPSPASLYQYQLSSAKMYFNVNVYTPSALVYSTTELGNYSLSYLSSRFGALQVGPDGKIYLAISGVNQGTLSFEPSPYLGVINAPNAMGKACNFKIDGFKLSTRGSFIGLPNIPSFMVSPTKLFTTPNIKCNAAFSLAATGGVSYSWSGPLGFTSTDNYLSFAKATNEIAGEYTVIITKKEGCTVTKSITVEANCDVVCSECVSGFIPTPEEKYTLMAWVKEDYAQNSDTYTNASIKISYNNNGSFPVVCKASGPVIDGWQRIEYSFTVPPKVKSIEIELQNASPTIDAYFDDIRIHPFKSNMKSFVYDFYTQKLTAELDESNFATKYEYDDEGILIRVKKETERGVMTIKETRTKQSENSKNKITE